MQADISISRDCGTLTLTDAERRKDEVIYMWFKKLLGVFVTLGLVLAACTGGGTTPSPSGSGDASSAPSNDAEQVLRVDLGGEPPTLDPTQATDSQSINVLRSITRPLAYFDENLEVVPGLAEDWKSVTMASRSPST